MNDKIEPVRLIVKNAREIAPAPGSHGPSDPDLRPVEYSDDALARALSDKAQMGWPALGRGENAACALSRTDGLP
jgi:hypothetical protein